MHATPSLFSPKAKTVLRDPSRYHKIDQMSECYKTLLNINSKEMTRQLCCLSPTTMPRLPAIWPDHAALPVGPAEECGNPALPASVPQRSSGAEAAGGGGAVLRLCR